MANRLEDRLEDCLGYFCRNLDISAGPHLSQRNHVPHPQEHDEERNQLLPAASLVNLFDVSTGHRSARMAEVNYPRLRSHEFY